MALELIDPDGSINDQAELPSRIPYWRLLLRDDDIPPAVRRYPYQGSGSEDNPYLVVWIPEDPGNPHLFDASVKWFITMVVGVSALAVTLASSAFTGGIASITEEFDISEEVATLGLALFVLGFAAGPLLWAPLSELYGRRMIFFLTYAALVAFNGGTCGANNPWTLLILRFFAGAFGSSPLANGGGVIADLFSASHRGLAMGVFVASPFLGPVLGPVVGGFLGAAAGWRWLMGFLTAFSGLLWIVGTALVPETYGPYLLRQRAARLSKLTGKTYISRADSERGHITIGKLLRTSLLRPWLLLIKEPIVLLLSLYTAIIYGTLYMFFGAYPIVYQQHRGWDQGVGSLPFLGILAGMLVGMIYNIPENRRYIRATYSSKGKPPPEARLHPALIGSIALPVGLFWFAWTNDSAVHWIVSVAAGAPFGFGMMLVFVGLLNYLMDSYTIFAASALAANSLFRSLFGAAFPMFTKYMYDSLGIHWASTVPAFLAFACVPFPFLFYRYGAFIRARCKYAAESERYMADLHGEDPTEVETEEVDEQLDASQRTLNSSGNVDGLSITKGKEKSVAGG